jgi:streptogrisin C
MALDFSGKLSARCPQSSRGCPQMIRSWPWILVMVVALLAAAPAGAGEPIGSEPDEPAPQSEADSLLADLTLIAGARGWSVEDAQANHEAADAVGQIAEIVAEKRPDIFVGSALSAEPSAPPTLYIKGPRDEFIDELVRSSRVPIVVADNQPFSFAELEARQQRVHEALLTLTDHIGIGFDVSRGGVMELDVARSERLPDEAAVLDAVPADLRSSLEIRLIDEVESETEAAYGGMALRRIGVPSDCTSGWTVQKVGSTTRGISGAGHCIGEAEVTHPGAGNVHALNFQAAHEGQWGDVEWYTTNQVEDDLFYADANMIRDVVSVEARANITQGEHVCGYGRASNSRDCSLTVTLLSYTCSPVQRLVRMSGDTLIGGDSGGPWYNTHIAFGAHFGNCSTPFDHFSPADLFDEALGVRVATN